LRVKAKKRLFARDQGQGPGTRDQGPGTREEKEQKRDKRKNGRETPIRETIDEFFFSLSYILLKVVTLLMVERKVR